FFSCFADGDQCDVVVLRDRTGKLAHVLYDPLHNRLRTIVCAGADRLHHTLDAKLVSLGIKRLGYAVSVKNEAIIALERYREIDCKPIEHTSAVNSHHHPGGLYRRNNF